MKDFLGNINRGFTLPEILLILFLLVGYGYSTIFILYKIRSQLLSQNRMVTAFDAANSIFERWQQIRLGGQKGLCTQLSSRRCPALQNANRCPTGGDRPIDDMLGCLWRDSEVIDSSLPNGHLMNSVCVELVSCQAKLGSMLMETTWQIHWYNAEKNHVESRRFITRKAF